MLLPSALPCDAPQPSRPMRQPTSYFSPPSSPLTLSSATALSNIMTTCRSLQRLISSTAPSQLPSAPSSSRLRLPTPPSAHAPLPVKLRLRTSVTANNKDLLYTRRKIAKRSPTMRGGVNKRPGPDRDEIGWEDLPAEGEVDHDADLRVKYQQDQSWSPVEQEELEHPLFPSTPKRTHIAPEQLPLGLGRMDYHDVHNAALVCDDSTSGPDEWSAEDDRILVEMVLERLKLSKSEWQHCARSLGKDRHSVSRRWRSLLLRGEVGVKTRLDSRRTRLQSTGR